MNLRNTIFNNKPKESKTSIPVIEKSIKRMSTNENENHVEHIKELLSVGLNTASAINKLSSTLENFPIEDVIEKLSPEVIETSGAKAVIFSDGSSLIKLPINETESKYIVERRNNSKKNPVVDERRVSDLSKALAARSERIEQAENSLKSESEEVVKEDVKAEEEISIIPPKKEQAKKSLFSFR